MHIDRRGFAYETFRDGGRVCRRYLGSGDAVALAFRLEQLKRKAEQKARGQKAEERNRERQEVEKPVALLDAQTSEILEALLYAAGYYRHRRGEWRKRRQDPMSKEVEKLRALQERAQNGDKEAARAFWLQVDSDPQKRAELVRQTGDMAGLALAHLMQKITQGDCMHLGGIQRQLDQMRSDLDVPNSSPLEALLIERVCVCWLQLHYFEALYAAQMEEATLEQSTFRQKQIDGANRRYLASIKALAQIRKLQLPTLQINLAEKQVNIGQMTGQAFGD